MKKPIHLIKLGNICGLNDMSTRNNEITRPLANVGADIMLFPPLQVTEYNIRPYNGKDMVRQMFIQFVSTCIYLNSQVLLDAKYPFNVISTKFSFAPLVIRIRDKYDVIIMIIDKQTNRYIDAYLISNGSKSVFFNCHHYCCVESPLKVYDNFIMCFHDSINHLCKFNKITGRSFYFMDLYEPDVVDYYNDYLVVNTIYRQTKTIIDFMNREKTDIEILSALIREKISPNNNMLYSHSSCGNYILCFEPTHNTTKTLYPNCVDRNYCYVSATNMKCVKILSVHNNRLVEVDSYEQTHIGNIVNNERYYLPSIDSITAIICIQSQICNNMYFKQYNNNGSVYKFARFVSMFDDRNRVRLVELKTYNDNIKESDLPRDIMTPIAYHSHQLKL
jgi:hypothetical protein